MWISAIHPNSPAVLGPLQSWDSEDWFQRLMTSIGDKVTFGTEEWGGFTCLQLFTWLPGCFMVYLENIQFEHFQCGRMWPFGRKYSCLLWIKLFVYTGFSATTCASGKEQGREGQCHHPCSGSSCCMGQGCSREGTWKCTWLFLCSWKQGGCCQDSSLLFICLNTHSW